MKRYNPSSIEPKWQKVWAKQKTYQAADNSKKPKYYALSFFPYPSGAGLHIGHVRNFTITDAAARFKRMSGYEVLHPMGWDSFGLPAESYAIKTGTPPQVTIKKNTSNFRSQANNLGLSIDWDREFASSDPSYYKWTQWFFLLLLKRGLAYRKESLQFWCETDKTILANEQVEAGRCWRCGNQVTKKSLPQWFFKITDYADQLDADLQGLDWPHGIKMMQHNWIGRSKGAEVTFKIDGQDESLTVFTTRPDTLFGVTFVVLAPEHPLVQKITTAKHKKAVADYIAQAGTKTDIDRMDESLPKTGVPTGAYAINPANGQKVPVWVADYVLAGYGTGAVMGVPGHDQRDNEFAKKFDLPIVEVIEPETGEKLPNAVFRRSIVAIVRDPKTGELLSLDWGQKYGGHLFVGGGREEGETPEQTAVREIREETGYTNVKLIAKTGKMHAHYYAHHKGVAREIEVYGLLFDLVNDTRADTALEPTEKGKFTLAWLPASAVEGKVTDPLHQTVYKMLVKGECYRREGRMVNSGKYDGSPSAEVRERIVADLAKQGLAREKTSYKLRDWLISRQRYWGAPIPVVHCQHCRKRIENAATVVNFYDQEIWQQIIGGHKTVESRADNPDEPTRRFADVADGGYLKFVNKKTNEAVWAKVRKAEHFKSLGQLFEDKVTLQAIFGTRQLPQDVKTLQDSYEALVEGYADRIQKHGLVTWDFELIAPGIVPVPQDQLPVVLPDMEDFHPSSDGRSPLAKNRAWVEVACPQCGSSAERETDTMDGFACSSWYALRFADPHNSKEPFSQKLIEHWAPVDLYVGGAEHAVMHLLYARMWAKVMADAGLVSFSEPFKSLRNQGMLLAEDGTKFSKSKGNGVDPDDIIKNGYGADALRTTILFLAPFDQKTPWSPEGLGGVYRFLNRVWTLAQDVAVAGSGGGESDALRRPLHRAIKKVSDDMGSLGFNTAIAALMELTNELYKLRGTVPINGFAKSWREAMVVLAQLLAPFAPHLAEELWEQFGGKGSVHVSAWPQWDNALLVEDTMLVVVQVNGKVRARLRLPATATQMDVETAALADGHVKKFVGSAKPRAIYIPGKLLNFVA